MLAATLTTVVETQVQPHWRHAQELGQTGGTYKPLRLRPCAPTGHMLDATGGTGHQDTPTQVTSWAEQLTQQILISQEELLKVAPTVRTATTGQHHLPRQICKRRQRLVQARAALADNIRSGDTTQQLPPHLQSRLHELLTATPPPSPTQACRALHKQVGAEIRQIDQEHMSRRRRMKTLKIQALIDTKLKIGGKIVTGQYQKPNQMALHAIQTHDDKLVTDPQQVVQLVEEYYTSKMAPATGVKNGKYLPTQHPRTYPWMQPGAQDGFEMTTPATRARQEGKFMSLHQQMVTASPHSCSSTT